MMLIKSWLPKPLRPVLSASSAAGAVARPAPGRCDGRASGHLRQVPRRRVSAPRCVRNFPPAADRRSASAAARTSPTTSCWAEACPTTRCRCWPRRLRAWRSSPTRPLRWLVAARSYYGAEDREMLESALTAGGRARALRRPLQRPLRRDAGAARSRADRLPALSGRRQLRRAHPDPDLRVHGLRAYRSWAATCRPPRSSPAVSASPEPSRRDPRRSPTRCGRCSATRSARTR